MHALAQQGVLEMHPTVRAHWVEVLCHPALQHVRDVLLSPAGSSFLIQVCLSVCLCVPFLSLVM